MEGLLYEASWVLKKENRVSIYNLDTESRFLTKISQPDVSRKCVF